MAGQALHRWPGLPNISPELLAAWLPGKSEVPSVHPSLLCPPL